MAFAQLKSRVLVTLVGAPLIIICVMVGNLPFMFLMSLILSLSLWEFYQLARKKNAVPYTLFSIIVALILLWDMYLYWGQHILTILTLYLIVISILQLKQHNGSQIINLATSLWGVVYVGVLLSFFVSIRQLPFEFGLDNLQGGYWTLTILLVIWIGDSVAYFVGSSIGKHNNPTTVNPPASQPFLSLDTFHLDFLGFSARRPTALD